MDFKRFNISLFDLNFKQKNKILQLRNKNIHIAFNMNGCFGNIKEIFYGIGNQKFTEFLYTNHFAVCCFKTDKECISYFETFKNEGVDINIHIIPETILIKKRIKRFSKTGKQKKDKIIKALNPIIEDFFKMPKIDLTIMNPPYDRNFHLKILEKVIPITDNIINISPVRWLQDPLANQKKSSDYKRFEDTISKKIENLDIYSAKEMQNVFAGTVMNMDLGIYTIGKGGYDYTKVSYNSILEKVFTHQQKLCNIESNKKLGWRVRMPTILGGKSGGSGNRKIGLSSFGKLLYFYNGKKDGKPWYDWYVKNQYSKTTPEITNSILFNSEVECKNFINSLQNTKFGKYVTHKLITDVHVSNKIVLWMDDYSKPWDDKRFCEYFGITGYISDTEAEPNSEWEIILNTMKEYV